MESNLLALSGDIAALLIGLLGSLRGDCLAEEAGSFYGVILGDAASADRPGS